MTYSMKNPLNHPHHSPFVMNIPYSASYLKKKRGGRNKEKLQRCILAQYLVTRFFPKYKHKHENLRNGSERERTLPDQEITKNWKPNVSALLVVVMQNRDKLSWHPYLGHVHRIQVSICLSYQIQFKRIEFKAFACVYVYI